MKKSLLAFVVALSMGFGQAATVATASSNIDGEEIRAFDFDYKRAPHGQRQAGEYSFVFTNTGPAFHVIIFVRLGPSDGRASKAQIITQIDLAGEAFMRGENPICPTCFFDYMAGGAAGPVGTTTPSFGPTGAPGPVLLLPGRYAYFCPVLEAGTPHYKLKMFDTFWAK